MTTVGDALEDGPQRFDAGQALRLAEGGRRPLGTDALPDQEAARISTEQTMDFAPAPVTSMGVRADGMRTLRVSFLGLTGPLGVLPRFYTEAVLRADRMRNRALGAFFDLFNHRLGSLHVRASEKYRLGQLVQREAIRPDQPAGSARTGTDPVSLAMLSLAGFGTPHISGRSTLPDETVLRYAGLFSARNRPASALQAMLGDYLDIGLRVVQFSGGWVPVPEDEQTRMGGAAPKFGRLGMDTVVGSRVWEPGGAIRIVVGPVRMAQFLALMPDQPLLARLVDLVRAYVGPELAFDVQVILAKEDIPAAQLGSSTGPEAPRLGWSTWARGLPALEDSDAVILNPDLIAGAMR